MLSSRKEPKSRSNRRQIMVLVDFMLCHRDFANGDLVGPLGVRQAEALWRRLKDLLKKFGPDRSVDQWKQTWKDLKKHARHDNALALQMSADGRSEVHVLSAISIKVLRAIGYDIPASSEPASIEPAEADSAPETNIELQLLRNDSEDSQRSPSPPQTSDMQRNAWKSETPSEYEPLCEVTGDFGRKAVKKSKPAKEFALKEYDPLSTQDEFYHWGMACAEDLRKMERRQQVFAKRAIAEVIMEGQLGLLQRHSVRVNEAPPVYPAQFDAWPSPLSYTEQPSAPTEVTVDVVPTSPNGTPQPKRRHHSK